VLGTAEAISKDTLVSLPVDQKWMVSSTTTTSTSAQNTRDAKKEVSQAKWLDVEGLAFFDADKCWVTDRLAQAFGGTKREYVSSIGKKVWVFEDTEVARNHFLFCLLLLAGKKKYFEKLKSRVVRFAKKQAQPIGNAQSQYFCVRVTSPVARVKGESPKSPVPLFYAMVSPTYKGSDTTGLRLVFPCVRKGGIHSSKCCVFFDPEQATRGEHDEQRNESLMGQVMAPGTLTARQKKRRRQSERNKKKRVRLHKERTMGVVSLESSSESDDSSVVAVLATAVEENNANTTRRTVGEAGAKPHGVESSAHMSFLVTTATALNGSPMELAIL
jgi:hypothetical protein